MSLAKVVVTGTVESDPEKRYTPNNHAVTSFSLAVKNPAFGNRQSTDDPFSVKITCWRALADAVAEQVRKDDEILVEGRLMMNSEQISGGMKKSFEIEASTIDKLPGAAQTIAVTVESAAGSGTNSNSDAGHHAAATRPATQKPAMQPQPVGVAATPTAVGTPTGSDSGFSADELLTEDDIPF